MTVAVCLNCGEMKHGAWTPCPKCGVCPDDDESMTKHLLVTDHYHAVEDLEAIAKRIKNGETIEFDPEMLKQARVSADDVKKQNRRMAIGCGVFLAIVIIIAVMVVVFTVLK